MVSRVPVNVSSSANVNPLFSIRNLPRRRQAAGFFVFHYYGIGAEDSFFAKINHKATR